MLRCISENWKSCVIGKQASFMTKSWFDHLIKLKALKHMQNLRANLKSNYLLGIILKLNYFLPSNSAHIVLFLDHWNGQKLSNKEIYFTLQNNNENYNRPFKFISWTNRIDRNPVFTPKTWDKIFTNWFKKCSDGYSFSIWYKFIHFPLPLSSAIHRMGNTPTILCLDAKKVKNLIPILYFIVNCPKIP